MKTALGLLIPELRESEDERIRREIIDFIQWAEDRGTTRHDYHQAKRPAAWITYLKKQKEIPTDAKQERVINAARRVLNNWLYGDVNADVSGDLTELEYAFKDYDGEDEQKEQKPAEWSEEDELMRTAVIQTLKMFGGRGTTEMQIDWLKSLRPQPHWKPSEEQMKHLERCFSHGHTSQLPNQHILESLYNELKKLT